MLRRQTSVVFTWLKRESRPILHALFFFLFVGVIANYEAVNQSRKTVIAKNTSTERLMMTARLSLLNISNHTLGSLPATSDKLQVAGYLPFAVGTPGLPGALGIDVSTILEQRAEKVRTEQEAIARFYPDLIGGIDYVDPVAHGVVPLQRVAGRLDHNLSRHFKVRDFAPRDGAPYARISDQLVDRLERLRARAGSLMVLSGYRYKSYNDKEVAGSAEGSQHIAGRAADVWSSSKTPLQLAGLALETMGCNIGLGLGAGSLHVDIRGQLASWTYAGAALNEVEFDNWVRAKCGLKPLPVVKKSLVARKTTETKPEAKPEAKEETPVVPAPSLDTAATAKPKRAAEIEPMKPQQADPLR